MPTEDTLIDPELKRAILSLINYVGFLKDPRDWDAEFVDLRELILQKLDLGEEEISHVSP